MRRGRAGHDEWGWCDNIQLPLLDEGKSEKWLSIMLMAMVNNLSIIFIVVTRYLRWGG
jgi:hypothetical protein